MLSTAIFNPIHLRKISNKCQFSRISIFKFSTRPQWLADIRDISKSGSKASQKLRKDGTVPGVLYGIDEDRNVMKVMIQMNEKDVMNNFKKYGSSLENTLFELVINETKHIVLPRQIQFNPVTSRPVSINFLKHWPGTRVKVPIEYINDDLCVDLRRGAYLVRVNRFIECICDDEIPQKLIVDLSSLKLNDVVRLNTLTFPPNVRPSPSVPHDFVAGVIKSGRGN